MGGNFAANDKLAARRDERYNHGAELDFMAPVAMQEFFINLCLPENVVNLTDPDFSSYYDDLHGLPPTILLAGECDALRPDMEAMAEKPIAANGNKQKGSRYIFMITTIICLNYTQEI